VILPSGVIEVTFHEDSDGYISLVGRPLTRPRTNSLSSSKILEDISASCVANSASTSSPLSPVEVPTSHTSHEAAAGPAHR